jgi:hypothetical protein
VQSSFIIGGVKPLALLILIALQCAGTTAPSDDRYNRRDLYTPEPATDSPETAQQMRPHPSTTAEPKPQFR